LLHHSPHPPPTTCYTTCGEASRQAGSCPEAKIARVYAKLLGIVKTNYPIGGIGFAALSSQFAHTLIKRFGDER